MSRLLFLGLGAAMMFFGDPQAGRKRRTDVRNQLDAAKRRLEHGTDMVVRDATNRAHGLILETRNAIQPADGLNGQPLKQVMANAAASWSRRNWSPSQRALAGAVGASVATIGYFRGGLKGFFYCLAGGALLARATANETLGEIARGGIFVEKTTRVDAPVAQVYAYWRNLENLPQWMSHVREVRYLGGDRYHWIVEGPAGKAVEWDSELLNVIENREMTWRSVEGSQVEHTGRVRFEEDGDGTRIHVMLRYYPPGGVVGHVVAKAFGVDPKTSMDEDLVRMKGVIETGRPPRDAAAQRRDEPPASYSRH
ncbi:MAG TPA: SRPBCC family protein [Usitatibacter sp.]|nr:SRPBCC family protein [Usitatibacter sp.]